MGIYASSSPAPKRRTEASPRALDDKSDLLLYSTDFPFCFQAATRDLW
jgi:hypothetical protein